jgi:hypothetical protein
MAGDRYDGATTDPRSGWALAASSGEDKEKLTTLAEIEDFTPHLSQIS